MVEINVVSLDYEDVVLLLLAFFFTIGVVDFIVLLLWLIPKVVLELEAHWDVRGRSVAFRRGLLAIFALFQLLLQGKLICRSYNMWRSVATATCVVLQAAELLILVLE